MTPNDYRDEFGSFYAQHLYFDLLNNEITRKNALRLIPRVFQWMSLEEKTTWRAMVARIKTETATRLLPHLR